MSLVSIQYRPLGVGDFRRAARRVGHIGNGWTEVSKMTAEPAAAVRDNVAEWQRMYPNCAWRAEPIP